MVASQESSLTAQGLITYNKTILVRPEEITFNQVSVNQAYSQVMTLQNTLSAPVEIVSKAPKLNRNGAKSESCQDHLNFLFVADAEELKSGEARLGTQAAQVAATRDLPSQRHIQAAPALPSEDYAPERDHLHQVGLLRLKSGSDNLSSLGNGQLRCQQSAEGTSCEYKQSIVSFLAGDLYHVPLVARHNHHR